MAATYSQQRAETPPPRRRGLADTEGQAAQQQVWSAKPGVNEEDEWTSSPLPRPRETLIMKDEKLLSPKAKHGIASECLLPVKVNEDSCFSSPKCVRGGEEEMFSSPNPSLPTGKENWQPGVALARHPLTPLKTPSRLPTVQEYEGQMPPFDEQAEEGMPAWVVQTPQPSVEQDLDDFAFDDVKCSLPKPTVKSTFITFVSPLKTFSVSSPPKTEPVNFAPTASITSVLFGDRSDEAGLAMSHSPMPWSTHEQIPFFPAPVVSTSDVVKEEPESLAAGPRQKGPVVRLAEFLPEPTGVPACQPPPPLDQSYWNMSNMNSMSMSGMMQGIDFSIPFGAGLEGMTSPGSFSMPEVMQGQPQWQAQQLHPDANQLQQLLPQAEQQQMPPPPQEVQFQMQQPHNDQMMQPPMDVQSQQMQLPQVDQATLHLMQSQLQQLQNQMQQSVQTPSMHMQPQLMQLPQTQMQPQFQLPPMQPPQMPPPQVQAPQLQPPEMQPPQTQAPQLPMEAEQMLLQQFMQLHMQTPAWSQLPPPQTLPCEQMSSPSAAPSVLCPSACHQVGMCRCGEMKIGETAPSSSLNDNQQVMMAGSDTLPQNTCILLSAAMFPEMGANTNNASTNLQH